MKVKAITKRTENQDGREDCMLMLIHDIRNYLCCAQGYGEISLQGRLPGASSQDCIGRALAAVVKAERLLEELCGLLHPQSQSDAMDDKPLVLEELLEDTLYLLIASYQQKGVTLSRHIPRCSTTVLGEREGLGRAIANLLANSLKFTPAGGQVTVALGRQDGTARVIVSDTGIGISKEDQGRIFEKFYQVEPHNHGSMGLGLHIAREIATSHGGQLTVESEGPGQGSSFCLTLPLSSNVGTKP